MVMIMMMMTVCYEWIVAAYFIGHDRQMSDFIINLISKRFNWFIITDWMILISRTIVITDNHLVISFESFQFSLKNRHHPCPIMQSNFSQLSKESDYINSSSSSPHCT